MMRRLLCAGVACWLTASVLGGGFVIFDNGGPDGSNGLSCGNLSFGYREVADDFVLDPAWPEYVITDAYCSFAFWSGDGLGAVTMFRIAFYEDDGNVRPAMEPFYTEFVDVCESQYYTGDWYFRRQEIVYHLALTGELVLPSDTPFWLSFMPWDPPENMYWLTSAAGYENIFRGEARVTYMDSGMPPWTPTSFAFGEPYDMAFNLTGYGVPEPGTLSVLALGALGLLRRG